MPVKTLPLLYENWPLFDWADFQSSRDALVKGTPTKQFSKNAWNALVDDLSVALTAAGIAWDSTYTTANGARITQNPPKLTAAAFNSVRLNIERAAPLSWAWAWDKTFRGYLGRAEVQGVSTHWKARDEVYPEYIIELSRRLNLLLEILRGTAMLSDAEALQAAAANIHAEAYSRQSARMDTTQKAITTIYSETHKAQGADVSTEMETATITKADADPGVAANAYFQMRSASGILADGQHIQAEPATPALLPIRSMVEAEAMAAGQIETAVDIIASSAIDADIGKGESLPIESNAVSNSQAAAEAAACGSAPPEAKSKSNSMGTAEATKSKSYPVAAGAIFKTALSGEAEKILAAPVGVANNSGVTVVCSIGTAWLPPVWIDGGLWIRQTQNVSQTENGELVIT